MIDHIKEDRLRFAEWASFRPPLDSKQSKPAATEITCVLESEFTTQLVLCSWQQGVSQDKMKYFQESLAAIIVRKS